MSILKNGTKIFTGNANHELAYQISEILQTRLSHRDLGQFQDGEVRCELQEHVRDSYIFAIQSMCAPVNDTLMEFLVLLDAIRRQGPRYVVAVVPYYGYSRQDRKPGFSRTPITSKLVATMLEKAGANHVVLIDIHSEQQLGFFDIPVINISASPELVGDMWRHHVNDLNNLVIVSPDTGGVARARSIAKQLDNADIAIVDKRRPEANVAEVMNIVGDVRGKRCIIVDDLIDTAGTLCKAGKALKENGAEYVAAYATHAVFSGNAYFNIGDSVLDEVVVTDSIPLDKNVDIPDNIRQISVASLLAETMRRIRSKQSISEIYTGA